MYTEFLTLEGTLEDVESINAEIKKQTDIDEWLDGDDWKAWVEWKDGKTIILAEVAG